MSYAILEHGGRQYKVADGNRLIVDRLAAEIGSMVALEPVLLVADDGGRLDIGAPALEGVRVAALVVAHPRGKKLRIFKYKPKKRNRKTMGFRADLTELRVASVLAKGEKLPEPKREAEPKADAKAKSAAKAKAGDRTEAKPKLATEAIPVGDTSAGSGAPRAAAEAAEPAAPKPTGVAKKSATGRAPSGKPASKITKKPENADGA